MAAVGTEAAAAAAGRALQDEFDRCLAEMKPHVLKLQQKAERQKCALWIKKLCENASTTASKKLRNAYGKVILVMLKSGRLEPPFASKPADGPLQELPAHLAMYLDSSAENEVPTWVANLSQDDDDADQDAAADDQPVGLPSRLPVPVGKTVAASAGGSYLRTDAPIESLTQQQLAGLGGTKSKRGAAPAGVPTTAPSATSSPPAASRPQPQWQAQQLPQQQQQPLFLHAAARQRSASPATVGLGLRGARDEVGSAFRNGTKEFHFSSDDEEDANEKYSAAVHTAADTAAGGGSGGSGRHSFSPGGSGSADRGDWQSRKPPTTKHQLRTSSPYLLDGDGYGYGNFRARDVEPCMTSMPPTLPFLRSSSPYSGSGGGGDGNGIGHRFALSTASAAAAAASSAAQEKEHEVRLKVLEARLHEDKLLLQQKHDAEVQKILDRKNAEIEEAKASYRVKIKEHEEAAAKLEKKLHAVLKDSALVRESKDQQIAELRRMAEESVATRQNEAERRIHDLVAEHEQDKFELQKQHTRAIHELMDETGARLAKMEDDYRQQAAITGDVIRELESRIQLLTSDAERVTTAKNSLEQHKAELESRVEQLLIESSQYRIKYEALSSEHTRAHEEHRRAVELAREKHETQMAFVRREQSLAASKAADAVAELEQRVAALRQAADEAEARHQQQAREAEAARRQDLAQAERAHEKKVRALQKEAEQQNAEHTKALSVAEAQVKDKETELQRLREQQRQQAAAAERALAELKAQVERHSERMYAETKQQMAQVEQDLLRSKSLREQQAKEYDGQLKDLKRAHEKELQSARAAADQEKQQLLAQERHQQQLLLAAHQQEVDHLTTELSTEKARYEDLLKETRAEHERQSASQSDELSALRDELVKNEQMRRQQLTELGLLRDEERQRQAREHERELAQLRADAERQRHELQRASAAEAERAADKTEARLKDMEKEYAGRLSKSSEAMRELQGKLEQLKATRRELTEQMELKLAEMATRCEEEKRSLRRQLSSTMVSLQEDVEAQHAQLRQAERRLRDAQAEHEERVLRLTIDYEGKMKGLMPASARQQLEDTIASLRNQVATLKQRVGLLQDELLESKRSPSSLGSSGGGGGVGSLGATAAAARDSRPLG